MNSRLHSDCAQDDRGMQKVLEASVAMFLRSLGVSTYELDRVASPASETGAVAGRIDFHGPCFSGTLMIVPDEAFVDHTNVLGQQTSPTIRNAWIAEMANQLMGVLKGKAAIAGVDVESGLPSVGTEKAPELENLSVKRDSSMVTLSYRCGTSRLRILLQALTTGEVSFDEEGDPEIVVGEAGDFLLL